MGIKKISLIISACFLLNNSIVFSAIDAPAVDMSTPVVQASVFQLVSLVRLPFTITSKLVREDAPLLPGYNKPAGDRGSGKTPARKNDTKAGKDYGFFFSSPGSEMRPDLKTDNFSGTVFAILKDLIQGSGTIWVNLIFYWLGFKYIFLLACLIALSKSNLPWEIEYSYA